MFYVIETEYVGPNPQQHLDSHSYHVQNCPGLLNMSHEPRTFGWLGTTNDWSENAHGEFDTLEEARAEIERLTNGDYREQDLSDFHDGNITRIDKNGNIEGRIVYRVLAGGLELWCAESSQDYCYDSMIVSIKADSTEEEIDIWVDDCANCLCLDENGLLDSDAVQSMALDYRETLKSQGESDE
jgi:hypothetical protein